MVEVMNVIDGVDSPAHSGRTFPSLNPATGEPWATVAFSGAEDVDRAVRGAWRAFDEGGWRDLSPKERARQLRAIARLVAAHGPEIAETESRDCGKPIQYATADVQAAVEFLDYVSGLPENLSSTVYAEELGYFTYSRREPYGVVGAIAPWNFPFVMAVWKTALPMAVGNCVVLKMAEQAPATTSMYAHLCAEAGLPAGVLQVVHGDGSTGAALVEHPDVPKITFTGSTTVGKQILATAAKHVKSCHVELGGKSPTIVFEDADVEQAVSGTLFSAFFNSGQICTTGSRILVAERLASDFLGELLGRTDRLQIDDPVNPATQLGPLISEEQRERVEGFVGSGQADGAVLVRGGGRPSVAGHLAAGYFVEPTIFTDVDPAMAIAQEEIFGPVASITTFDSEDDAVRLANGVRYGLSATIWTTRLDRAFSLAGRLNVGIVWTNCPHRILPHVPYEGHKASGSGEDLGFAGAQTFTKLKVNYVNFGGHRIQWI